MQYKDICENHCYDIDRIYNICDIAVKVCKAQSQISSSAESARFAVFAGRQGFQNPKIMTFNLLKNRILLFQQDDISKNFHFGIFCHCQALSISLSLPLSISQSLKLSLSMRDRGRADTIITFHNHHTTTRNILRTLELTYT